MIRIFIVLLSLFISISGCKEGEHHLLSTTKKFTNKDKELEVNVSFPVFSSTVKHTDESCRIFNDSIELFISELKDSLQSSADKLFQDLKEKNIPMPSWKYSFYVTDSIFNETSDFISLRLTVYHFTGGAHGMTNYYGFNYDVKNKRFITNMEILQHVNSDELNELVKTQFKNPEKCFTTEPEIEHASAINFSPAGICFTYEQYVLGPYACGAAEIAVPGTELKFLKGYR